MNQLDRAVRPVVNCIFSWRWIRSSRVVRRRTSFTPSWACSKRSAQRAAVGVFAVGLELFAALKDDLALDGFDDFQNGNVRGVLDQRKAAAGAAIGPDQTRL